MDYSPPPEGPLARYKRRMLDLLAARRVQVLTQDEEGARAEELDDLWRLLAPREQASLEPWLRDQLRGAS